MTNPIKLYALPLSGNSYKVRLFLSLLNLPFEEITLDWQTGDVRSDWFVELNPRREVPVLTHGDLTIWDSQAILAYLARKFAPEWFPVEPALLAPTMQWLAVSEQEIFHGLAFLRAKEIYGIEIDTENVQRISRAALDLVETRLAGREWLVSDRPTVADVACFPYVALSKQGSIQLSEYPSIEHWIGRVKALPGFISLTGLD